MTSAPAESAPAPVTEQQPTVVETPVQTPAPEPEKFGINSIIDKISNKSTPQDAPPVEQAGVADQVTDAVAPPAEDGTFAAPPSLVTEISADIPEGTAGLRARDADGRFVQMDADRLYDLTIRDPQTGEAK